MSGDLVPVYRRSELEAVSDGCLKRYKAIWIDGADDTSDAALVGIGFAAVKHQYILALVDHQMTSDADLAEHAFIVGVGEAKTPARLIPDLHDLWRHHAEKFELPLDRFVSVEQRGVEHGVAWAPDLVLAHTVDNVLEVIDDKSGWNPPLSEEEVRTLFQARVYARYARDRFPGFFRYRFTLLAVRFNTFTSVDFTHEELDRVDSELAAVIQTLERARQQNDWPAVPGRACHFCQLACPIADQQLTLPKRLTVEQYQRLGDWLLVADKQLKAMKKLLKASVEVYGPCRVGDVTWDNRPVVSRTYPVRPVLNALDDIARMGGLDPTEDQELTISHTALKPFFKRFPALERELQDLAQEKTSFRFGAKQAGVGDMED